MDRKNMSALKRFNVKDLDLFKTFCNVFSCFTTFDIFLPRSGLGVTLGSKVFLINFGQASEVGGNPKIS